MTKTGIEKAREIKFRAWDGIRIYEVEKLVCGEVSYPDEVAGYNIFGEDKTNFKLMQYTGLKDKNGKDIYEWDIIKSSGGTKLVEYEVATGFFGRLMDGENPAYCEVIGNIYENPELLSDNLLS